MALGISNKLGMLLLGVMIVVNMVNIDVGSYKPKEVEPMDLPLPNHSAPIYQPQYVIPMMEETENYNHNLTMQEYALLEPKVPTPKWLDQCAQQVANDTSLTNEFTPKRHNYVLGDCIRLCRACHWGTNDRMDTVHSAISLAYKATRSCPPGITYRAINAGKTNYTVQPPVVSKVLLDMEPYNAHWTRPRDDEVVIHFRLGDVIEGVGANVSTMLVHGWKDFHAESQWKTAKKQGISVKSFYMFLEDIGEFHNVTMVGGSQKGKHYKKSKPYAHCLQRGFARAGKTVQMELQNGDPDRDFHYIAFAKNFIEGPGGFSRLLGWIVDEHNGTHVGYGIRPWGRPLQLPNKDQPESNPFLEADEDSKTPNIEVAAEKK